MSQPEQNRKLGEVITETIADLQILIRQQIDLTVAELKDSAKNALLSSGLVIAAGALLLVSLLLLIISFGFLLASFGLSYWLAFLLDALIFIALAVALLLAAKWRATKVRLPRTALTEAETSINQITATVTRTDTAG